jgi:hypothetical protein
MALRNNNNKNWTFSLQYCLSMPACTEIAVNAVQFAPLCDPNHHGKYSWPYGTKKHCIVMMIPSTWDTLRATLMEQGGKAEAAIAELKYRLLLSVPA